MSFTYSLTTLCLAAAWAIVVDNYEKSARSFRSVWVDFATKSQWHSGCRGENIIFFFALPNRKLKQHATFLPIFANCAADPSSKIPFQQQYKTLTAVVEGTTSVLNVQLTTMVWISKIWRAFLKCHRLRGPGAPHHSSLQLIITTGRVGQRITELTEFLTSVVITEVHNIID